MIERSSTRRDHAGALDRKRTIVVACALFCMAMMTPALRAQELARAEEHFRADRLDDAAPLYTTLLARTRNPAERQLCYERLLTIHTRLGRADLGIQLGLDYESWLAGREPARRRQLTLELARLYAALGHHRDALRQAESYLRDWPRLPAIPALQRLQGLTVLAQAADAAGTKALPRWVELENLAQAQLARAAEPNVRVEAAKALAISLLAQKKPQLGQSALQDALTLHKNRNDPAGQSQTLRLLAELQTASGEFAAAEKSLRAALTAQQRLETHDRLFEGDLLADLAKVLQKLGRSAEAAKQRVLAAERYQAVRSRPRPGEGGPEAAFFKLQALYQASRDFDKALQLARTPEQEWSGQALLAPRLDLGRGSLELQQGSYAQARASLRAAVNALEKQTPVNLALLPRALVNLAMVEAATEGLEHAELLARACRELQQRHQLPPGTETIDALAVLGSCSAQHGKYAVALDRYREGLELCDRLGARADPQRAGLLVHIALLHKSQGDVKKARSSCKEAEAVYRRFVEADDIVFAILDAAQINLALIDGTLASVRERIERVLAWCRGKGMRGGPLLTTARFCQALDLLSRRAHGPAEAALKEVLGWQVQDRQTLQMPRTLNYLGVAAELRGQANVAENYYREARQKQLESPRSYPATQFITLWRLAVLLDRKKQTSEARRLLNEGVSLVERARLGFYGDSQKRAGFFAQFAPGMEQLVDWHIHDGDLEAALVAVTRARSRTLLDHLLQARVDPRAGLKGARAEGLLRMEKELRDKISALRAKAQLTMADADTNVAARARMLAEFEEARQQYAAVWSEVLSDSPLCRDLSDQNLADTLPPRLRRLLRPRTALLVYSIGRERSYLLLAGAGLRNLEAFELHVPRRIAEQALPPVQLGPQKLFAGGRGLLLKRTSPVVDAPASNPLATEPRVRVTERTAAILADAYRNEIALPDPDYRPSRGLSLRTRPDGPELPVLRQDLVGEIFLPLAARHKLRELAPDCLVVVPDGPLHRLPLEAMRISAGASFKYLVDELPPIVYAPSAAILGELAQRPVTARKGGLSLLTVANPLYATGKKNPKQATDDAQALEEALAGVHGALPPLPETATESRAISRSFDVANVLSLTDKHATEGNVVKHIAGRHVVHLAAHGFADERFGNLFGAIVLTPPPPREGAPNNDGFLSLNEICLLPLGDCELAVLSACMTNVGRQQHMEAGVTLASGFLSAGARRVVASHWSVDDEATAELMGIFFSKLTATARAGEPLAAARALRHAQQRLRENRRWQSPFYWAPFVVIGPPDPMEDN